MPDAPAGHGDVRMRGFRERTSVRDALARIESGVVSLAAETTGVEMIAPVAATGRVLAAGASALLDVPGFDRSAMDGYAVRASETFGASAYSPLRFTVVGQSLPGAPHRIPIQSEQAVRIMTGAPLPAGADAVVMAEHVRLEGDHIDVMEAVTPGRHVGRRGEDVRARDPILPAGRVLRPQDCGLLAATGHGSVSVVRRPRVAVLVTGDEVRAPDTSRTGLPEHCILDSNSPMLAGLIARDGGELVEIARVGDERALVRGELERLAAAVDVVVVSGGSSVGSEDHAPTLLAELGQLLVHGVALRPAGPAGFGRIGSAWIFLLPGNPVSCLCAFDLFAGPAIRRRGGRAMDWPHRRVRLPLARKIASAIGRVDYVRVRIAGDAVEPIATSGASILSSTTAADGVVLVPEDSEGHPPGATVEVNLYDEH